MKIINKKNMVLAIVSLLLAAVAGFFIYLSYQAHLEENSGENQVKEDKKTEQESSTEEKELEAGDNSQSIPHEEIIESLNQKAADQPEQESQQVDEQNSEPVSPVNEYEHGELKDSMNAKPTEEDSQTYTNDEIMDSLNKK